MDADISVRPEQPLEAAVSMRPVAVLKVLTAITLILGLAHLAATPVFHYGLSANEGPHVKIARFFMLQQEAALSTWFTTVLIAFNMFLLALNATAARQFGTGSPAPWLVLAALFAYLSMDEMLVLHERAGQLLGRRLQLPGVLAYFPWVTLGAIFVAIAGLSFAGFLKRLPRRTAKLFLLSGGIYVGGALGIEVIEAATMKTYGPGLLYYFEVLVEETMEMFGQALFAYALLDHLARRRASIIL